MKFAKTLQEEHVPEWKTKYIDYKGLKKMVKEVALSISALSENEDSSSINKEKNTDTYASTSDMALLQELRKTCREKFLKRLEEELEKINSFYFEQEKEAVVKKEKILEQLKIVSYKIESSIHPMGKSERIPKVTSFTSNDTDIFQNQMTWAAWKEGIKSPKSHKRTVSSSDAHVEDHQMSTISDTPSPSGSFLGLNNLFRPRKGKSLGRTKMKKAMLEYYRNLDILKGYKTLNYTGFLKILKKFDKYTGLNVSSEFMPLLTKSYFSKSKKLDDLSKEIENVYQIVFADGDHRKAMRKLRLPDLKHHPHHQSAFRGGLLLGISLVCIFLSILSLFRSTTTLNPNIVIIYGSIGLPLLMAWLCGINFYAWEKAYMNYKFIFEVNPRDNLNLSQYFECLSYFTFLWSFFSWLSIAGYFEKINDFLHPLFVNFALILFLVFPLNMFYRSSRFWFIGVLFGIFRTPFIPVYFKDFFVADQFQSLTYFFRIAPLQFCFYNEYNNESDGKCCVPSKLGFVLVIGLVPAVLRFLQCCRRYNDTKMWFPHLANAAKYSTSFFAAMFNGFYGIYDINGFRTAYIVINCIGTCFALYWDYIMDWGYFQPNCRRKFLRKVLVYKWHWFYYFAAVSNMILRIMWIFPFIIKPAVLNPMVLAYILAVLEVFRRFQWNFFRVEYEHINNCGKLKAMHDLQLPFKADLFYNEMSAADMEMSTETIPRKEDEEDNEDIRNSNKLDIMEFSRTGSPNLPTVLSSAQVESSAASVKSLDNVSI